MNAMSIRFRFQGEGVPPPLGSQNHEDGFTVTIPAGYVLEMNPIPPPLNQQEELQQILQASGNRRLNQAEVRFLLTEDTIELSEAMVKVPINGLYMYPIEFRRQRDGHRYGDYGVSHAYSTESIGGGIFVEYRHSTARNLDGEVVTTCRRYTLLNYPEKYLIHYIPDINDDGIPLIPAAPPAE